MAAAIVVPRTSRVAGVVEIPSSGPRGAVAQGRVLEPAGRAGIRPAEAGHLYPCC